MIADPSLSCPHVAYSIGRAHGHAVTRNRLRRRLQALLAERAGRLGPGWYLVSADPAAGGLGADTLAGEVDRLVDRLTPRRSD
jgi:ribonuclease P protein component